LPFLSQLRVPVFAQKIYSMEDVYVGWQFGQIFYQKDRKWLHRLLRSAKKKAEEGIGNDNIFVLDKELIHDILPQQGGGHEPIQGAEAHGDTPAELL